MSMRTLTFRASILGCVLLLGLGLLVGNTASAQLRVVTTTTDLKSLTEFVGGDLVTVTSIGTGREDVHLLAAKPSFMVQANRADLWIRQGLELEIGFEPLVLEGARNPDIHIGRRGHLDVSAGVRVRDVPTTPVDRSMGDVHPMGDPHYHSDPFNARVMARHIRDRLIDLDPANEASYRANYDSFLEQLATAMFGEAAVAALEEAVLWQHQDNGTLDQRLADAGVEPGGWYARLRPHAGTPIVTYHRSWGYFADRFELVILDQLEPKPGIPPTSRHLAELAARMEARNVPVILMEPYYSRRAPDLIADRTGATVVEVGNMVGSEAAATDYLAMIDNIVARLGDALDATSD